MSITENLSKFASVVSCIAEYGYDPKRVFAEFNNIQYLDGKKRALEISTKELEESVAELSQRESLLQDKIYLHSENLPVYDELANLGFGSSESKNVAQSACKYCNLT